MADKLYDTHIETLRKEGQINGQEIQRVARQDVARGSSPCCCTRRSHARANATPRTEQGPEGDAGRSRQGHERRTGRRLKAGTPRRYVRQHTAQVCQGALRGVENRGLLFPLRHSGPPVQTAPLNKAHLGCLSRYSKAPFAARRQNRVPIRTPLPFGGAQRTRTPAPRRPCVPRQPPVARPPVSWPSAMASPNRRSTSGRNARSLGTAVTQPIACRPCSRLHKRPWWSTCGAPCCCLWMICWPLRGSSSALMCHARGWTGACAATVWATSMPSSPRGLR